MPVISESTAADNEIVAGVAGKKIVVTEYLIVAAGAVVATFKTEGGAALTGAMTMATGIPISARDEDGLFETVEGEGLDLTLSGGVQVSGHFKYRLKEGTI